MKKTLFALLTSIVLLGYTGCKSDLEPQVSFTITKQSAEGLVSVTNTTNMYETATIDWGDGSTKQPITNVPILHTFPKNGSYNVQLEAKNGKKTAKNINVVEIKDVSGRIGIYTQLPIGQNTEIGMAGLFCQINGNGILKYFYISKGIGADLNSCSQLSDENIWKVPAGDYLVYCENMGKKFQWNFNVRVESGKCSVKELTK